MVFKKRIPIIFVICVMFFSCFTFVNARESKVINIPFSHKMIDLKTSETFEFLLEKKTENAPLPKETLKSIKGNGNNSFDITISEGGRFDYTLKEIKGNNKDTKYDSKVYNIIIIATYDENNELVVSVVLEDGTNIKPNDIKFVDSSKTVARIKPIIKKKIKHNKNYKDEFRFKLKNKNKTLTTSIKGEGKTSFKTLKFKKPGTYTYSVYELKDKKSDWNYDDRKYEYVVTVSEENGYLTAKANYSEMKFTNSPTLLKKAKRLANIVSGGNNSQTGDSNNYLRYACIVALIALIALIVIGWMKKVK